MPRLKLHKPPGDAVRALARSELAAAARDLEAAKGGGNVHEARKRLKFARSLLQFARPAIGRSNFMRANAALREAARGLASARHAEALLEAIDGLGEARGEAEATALAALATIARATHEIHHAPEAIGQAAIMARNNVLAVRKAVASWSIARTDTSLLLDGAERAYARARRLIRKGLAAGDAELLHESRKSIIHHLHHLEMLAPLWPGLIKAWTVELSDMREALGDLHDLDDLATIVARQGDLPAGAIRDAAEALIAARRKVLLKWVRHSAGHLFAERPAAFRRRMAAMWRHAAD
jgi:CHAD domain-containing protein